jgi:hypothetical protein
MESQRIPGQDPGPDEHIRSDTPTPTLESDEPEHAPEVVVSNLARINDTARPLPHLAGWRDELVFALIRMDEFNNLALAGDLNVSPNLGWFGEGDSSHFVPRGQNDTYLTGRSGKTAQWMRAMVGQGSWASGDAPPPSAL